MSYHPLEPASSILFHEATDSQKSSICWLYTHLYVGFTLICSSLCGFTQYMYYGTDV